MKVADRVYQILAFNDNLAYSILELLGLVTDKIWLVKYFKLLWALSRLERKGFIVSRHIGGQKYFMLKRKEEESTQNMGAKGESWQNRMF